MLLSNLTAYNQVNKDKSQGLLREGGGLRRLTYPGIRPTGLLVHNPHHVQDVLYVRVVGLGRRELAALEAAEDRRRDDGDGEDLLRDLAVYGGHVALVEVLSAVRRDLLGAARCVEREGGTDGCWGMYIQSWKVSSISKDMYVVCLGHVRKIVDRIEYGLRRHLRSGD